MPSKIKEVTESFIKHIESLSTTLPLTMVLIQNIHNETVEKYEEFEEQHIDYEEREDDVVRLIEADHLNKFQKIDKNLAKTGIAQKVLPRSFVVSLVSQFDAFIGSLVRELLNAKPEILSDSERKLSFSQLSEFPSLEDAKEYIIDKEIDGLLRDSHADQFKWMSKKFNIKLDPKQDLWAKFIELTERRNLFVHADGKITTQYLSVCKDHGVDIDSDHTVGSELWVPQDYFEEAYSVIFEIGVKLSQVLWRKIIPQEIDEADKQLISFGFDLLKEEKYNLAYRICHFGTDSLKNIHSEEHNRFLAINKSLALKWNGENEESKELINSFDWSGWKDELLLAVEVINDNYENTYELMHNIGDDSELLSHTNYRHWPLFKEIKQKEKFRETYEEIFDHSFSEFTKEDQQSLEEE